MSNHIIESIGAWGVVTTPYQYRISCVRPGDIVEVPPILQYYPCQHRYSRIATISEEGIAHICEDMGSAFLLKDGSCDISGGPWWGVPTSLLQPTGELYLANYWNWGYNSPGAGQGVHYDIYRPKHLLTVHPDNLKQRFGNNEENARKGRFNHENPLTPEEYTLYFTGKKCDSDGERLYVFLKTTEPHNAEVTDTEPDDD